MWPVIPILNSFICIIIQVQRQLQLRIEAQGKYLKKIIEEQQRISGVLTEPGSDTSNPTLGDPCQDSDKTDPSTPAPMSESPGKAKVAGDLGVSDGLFKGLTRDDSFSSRREPLTPDSSGRAGSPQESPKHEGALKKQKDVSVPGHTMEIVLANHIFESSSGSGFQRPSAFPNGGSNLDLSADKWPESVPGNDVE
ncbi:hypothetical protein Taro_040470 [Colocasia esculenta]|uniref:MYB-CC type transcription factor LHEQLE-containing domain-containing protein n=1 Tax=Colocasia esculenta TaxID=4460 RepID=A0A843WDB7_COLES|nr:hypothetical protein [Colocasia esculenta]